MLGAIVGDIIGSVYENENVKTTEFPLFTRFSRFTDDSVLTIAIADAVLNRVQHPIWFLDVWKSRQLYAKNLKRHGRHYPQAGYGYQFERWLHSDSIRGYGSYGNGSAMRISPIGWAFEDLDFVQREAKLSASVTHNHPHGICGAQAAASAVFLARMGETKASIRAFIERRFHYDLSRRLDDIRPTYQFDSSCQGSVPVAIIAFLESDDFEDAICKAISIGGDSDTIAAITGSIAHAYYRQIPTELRSRARLILDGSLHPILDQFCQRYNVAK